MLQQTTQKEIELTTSDTIIIRYYWETPLANEDGRSFYDNSRMTLKRTEISIQSYGRGTFPVPFSVVVMINALYKQIADAYNEPVKPE